MARSRLLVLALLAIGATSALAETPSITFEVEAVPFSSRPGDDLSPARPQSSAPVVVYDHTDALTIIAPPGAGIIWADDVHLAQGGDLRRLMFGYFMNLGFTSQATFWVFASDPEDSQAPSDLLLGPVTIPGSMRGSNNTYTRQVINFNDEESIVRVPKDLWVAVSFTSDNPGLVVVQGDANIGHSHNIYYDVSARRTQQLADYPSNFVFQVSVDPVPTAVQALTWSKVKALFAAPTRTRPSN